jgi:two-component system cell cycle sensor histidine kinase/response regulator CckA
MVKNKPKLLLNIKLLSKRKLTLIVSTLSAIILSMMVFIYSSYNEHKNIIIQQQKEQLSIVAQAISRNLELCIEDKTRFINVYFEEIADLTGDFATNFTNDFFEAIDKFYAAQNYYIDSVYYMNREGRVIYRKGIADDHFLSAEIRGIKGAFLNKITVRKQAVTGSLFMGSGKYFLQSIIKPIFKKDKLQGYILCTVNLEKIYNYFIAPIEVGKKGYIMVKDRQERIIMYQDKKQIGIDVIKGRKEKYPGLYYKDLENLVKRQMTGIPGTAVYYSYWWTDRNIRKVQKINAFAPIKIGEDFWVISVQRDFKEVETPVKNNLNNILLLSFIILVILCGSVFVIMRLVKNTQTLEIETKYLKELNKSFEELRKSEEKARHYQKLQTIGTLTGGIAHEFNNLLTPILGYCEIMLKNIPKDSDTREDILAIHKIAKKGAELVKQILVYGRLDTGMYVFKPLQIGPFVQEALSMVKKVIPRSIQFVEKINPDCGYINANAAMLNQVLVNLCINAYQAMKHSNGTLTIEVAKIRREEIGKAVVFGSASEAYIMLRVTDTGCGMDEQTKRRIFDPFFTTKDVGEGTGLGLWLVQSIVAEHKGEIAVQSEEGKGSVFSIYFPWMTDEIQEEQFDIVNYTRRDNLRILLLDDETDIVKVFKKGLAQMGYTIHGETDPYGAIARFKANSDKYDVIITDYTMPKINGLEVAGIIKNIRDSVKIILMTGYMEKNVQEFAENRYIDGFLSKPVSCDELDMKIQTLFQDI